MADIFESRPDEDLKRIASDLAHGKIFTTQHQYLIDHPDNISTVFMPLSFMKPEDSKEFWEKRPGMLFEALENANSRSVDGLPIFFSMQVLNEADAKKVFDYYQEIKKAETQALG